MAIEKKTEVMSVYIAGDLKRAFQAEADTDCRSLNGEVIFLITKFVRERQAGRLTAPAMEE